MERKVIILDHHPHDCRTSIAEDQKTIQTLTSRMGTGGGNVPIILEAAGFVGMMGSNAKGIGYEEEKSPTISAYQHAHVVIKVIAVLGGGREHSTICMDETAPTLCTFQDSKPILIARIDNAKIL